MDNDKGTKQFVSMAVAIVIALSMILSATALLINIPVNVTGADVSEEQVVAQPPSTEIWLKNARFNTAMGDPAMPSTLGINAYPNHVKGTYIVQKSGAVTEEWKADIARAGGEILSYIPDNALLVRMDNSAKGRVEAVNGNQWTGIYQPAYKISPELDGRHGEVTVNIDIFDGGNNGPAVRLLKDNGGTIISVVRNDNINKIVAKFDASLMGDLASFPDVSWMSEGVQNKIVNDGSVLIAQSGVPPTSAIIHGYGIQGQGQVVAIGDSGLAEGLGATDVDHDNFNGGGYDVGSGDKVLDYYVPGDADGALGDEAGASYHGSHVAGTVLGDGAPYGAYTTASYDGHAYMAQVIFQDMGREDDPATPVVNEVEFIYSPTDSYNDMFFITEEAGAKFHTNSWGGGFGYMSDAQQEDLYMWDSQDYTILFAAGNDGAADTVGSQAELKNGFAVASLSATGTSLSSFSSRGPAVDGRIKPDIAFCGESIMSVDGGGGFQSMQGTSMATPGVAGNLALVRQYYTEGWYPTGAEISANGFNPSAALIKATVLNGGNDISSSRPDFSQGWGRLNLDDSLYFSGDAMNVFAHDNLEGMVTGDYIDFPIGVDSGALDFTATVVWTDYPGNPTAAKMLVNDLGLLVMGPGGTQWRGNNHAGGYSQATGTSNNYDSLNNVEDVRINNPAAGTYVVRVSAENIAMGPQNFAVVISGALTDGYGMVFMDRTVYDDADSITVTVEDSNNPAPTVDVTLTTAITGDSETITLGWTAIQSGVYNVGAPIATNVASVAADGVLQVAHGDTITASYDDGDPSFTATTVAWADFHGPLISNVFVTGITGTTGVPTWDTDENADSLVTYRTAEVISPPIPAGSWLTSSVGDLSLMHSVPCKGLAEDTKYEFYVESTDWRGRTTMDDNGGRFYTFRTTSAASGGALILLVDDDIGSVSDIDGAPFELDWMNNLDNYGWTYTHWDMNILGSPTTADLNQAPMIIWTVSEGYPQIGVDDRAALKGYLDQGLTSSGTVPMALVSGQDVGWDMGPEGTDVNVAWLADYLASTYNRDDADGGAGNEGDRSGNPPGRVDGIIPMMVNDIGHPLNSIYSFNNMDLEQTVYGADRFWPDSLDVAQNIQGTTGVASWDYDSSQVAGDCAAVAQIDGGLAGNARIQFEGFSHDMLTTTGAANWDPAGSPPTIDAYRAGVLDETVQWLLGGNHPTVDLADPIGGETITAAATYTIDWTVAGASSVDVYYSANSGQEYIKINGAPLPGTQTSLSWDISALEDADTYRVKVVALGSAIYSTLSDYSESLNFEIDHDIDNTPPITIPGSVNTDLNPIAAGDTVVLTATIDDSTTGMSTIQAAEWCIAFSPATTPSWPGTAMSAQDGTFDAMIEGVTVTIPGSTTSSWATGVTHHLWVRGQDSAGNWAGSYETEITVTGVAVPPSTYDFGGLATGWNFVSFPVDVTNTVLSVFDDDTWGDGGTDWDIITWYNPSEVDHWKTYDKNQAAAGLAQDMPLADNMKGFWIHITTADNDFEVGNGVDDASTGIALSAGWNLVGYPANDDSSYDVNDLIAATGATAVEGYGAGPYDLVSLAGNYVLVRGEAYWVKVGSGGTWTVDW